jgi:type IV secretion system protein VirD4
MTLILRHLTMGECVAILKRMIDERTHSQDVVDGILDFLSGKDDQVHGIRKSASTRLSPWFNPYVAAATARSDFDLRDLRRRPMTIYVRVQPGNIPRLRPLLALFFDALVNLNTDATPEEDPSIKHQALIILDEFARLGKMESLAEAAQYARGYGMRFLYVVQNIAQLRTRYGADGAQDILDNTGAEIVFGTNDLTLTKELSERMGDDTINVVTKNRPRFMAWAHWSKQSEAEHPHRRPLMIPQEIARLDPTEQIILRPGMMPMKTGRARWFTDQTMSGLQRPAPVIPRLDVQIAMHYPQHSARVEDPVEVC